MNSLWQPCKGSGVLVLGSCHEYRGGVSSFSMVGSGVLPGKHNEKKIKKIALKASGTEIVQACAAWSLRKILAHRPKAIAQGRYPRYDEQINYPDMQSVH